MTFREATVDDIEQLHIVRVAVKENRLSNPNLITPADYEEFLTKRGKGWLCEINNMVTGFAIADLTDHNVWALFVHPDHDKKGIGRKLHDIMMNWYFKQTNITMWLGTAPNTRAEQFYRKAGWDDKGLRSNAEIRFEMTAGAWRDKKVV